MKPVADDRPAPSQLEALPRLHGAEAAGPPLVELSQLSTLDLHLEVPLGHVSVTIGDLLALKAGSLLSLERLTGQHLELLANGTPIAKGEIRIHGERFAIRITEILGAKTLSGVEREGTDETPASRDS